MNGQNGFFDKKTIYAGIVVFAVLMLWQTYLDKKYRNQAATNGSNVESPATPTTLTPADNTNIPITQETKVEAHPVESPAAPEVFLNFENNELSFKVSNLGMSIKDFTLKNHTDRQNNPIKIGTGKDGMFSVGAVDLFGPLVFNLNRVSETVIEGMAEVHGVKIKRTLSFDSSNNSIKNTVEIENLNPEFKGITVLNSEKSIGHVENSMFKPTFESQEVVTLQNNKEERIKSSALKEKVEKDFTNVRLVGISSHYFTTALVDKSDVAPEVKIIAGAGVEDVLTQLSYKPALTSKPSMKLEWISYAGGKSVSVLEKVDKDLNHVLDLGMFSALGIIQMYAMQWFHSIIPNWGLAIILLTLLVRLIVLPLNITTFRSTRKMQEVQPKIAVLKERYKDDPQALNREMMNVWKENKINPFGGCLPMLLQLPVFFALYQVLGQSIELYQAPFIGWIHDLSQKDPFYVLPVLMAIAMFFQQKLTPTASMDPNQAKMMQFLPLVFALMMINLPAGLTLYIFINTVSGIILQQLTKPSQTTAASAK